MSRRDKKFHQDTTVLQHVRLVDGVANILLPTLGRKEANVQLFFLHFCNGDTLQTESPLAGVSSVAFPLSYSVCLFSVLYLIYSTAPKFGGFCFYCVKL